LKPEEPDTSVPFTNLLMLLPLWFVTQTLPELSIATYAGVFSPPPVKPEEPEGHVPVPGTYSLMSLALL
jgi:hypothetical protein